MRHKIYVSVFALFSEDGSIKPLEVIWEDGRRFEVQKITDVRRAASLKGGGSGIRYTCLIEGKERYLFLEDIMPTTIIGAKWFVEAKDN